MATNPAVVRDNSLGYQIWICGQIRGSLEDTGGEGICRFCLCDALIMREAEAGKKLEKLLGSWKRRRHRGSETGNSWLSDQECRSSADGNLCLFQKLEHCNGYPDGY